MKKVLIANRGEIAVRIVRTCRDMGLASAAVYSECDRTALHVRLADEAHPIGPDQASESYLRGDKIIDTARRCGADAVHPGYGFLAENGGFAAACRDAGLTFIGPSPEAIVKMGSKTGARRIAVAAGVPVVPGADAALSTGATDREIFRAASAVGYPLLVKAVAGGGGKGMRLVSREEELLGAVSLARSESRSAFGDDAVFLERRLEKPRHIEVQLLGDSEGTIRPFVERECSIQRRHQKLVEETPSPSVDPRLRGELAKAATAIGRAVGYTSAGTVEFLVDPQGRHYFLEMNARLQVEHPATEAVTGVDFVRAQIEIAQGASLKREGRSSVDADEKDRHLSFSGHAVECRVYAEDPEQGFLPSPGLITHLRAPSGPGIRDESGATAGWVVPASYDPLISKVIAWGPDRPTAIARMVRALGEYDLRGIRTTIDFCRWLLQTPAFAAGRFDTTSIDALLDSYRTSAAARDADLEDLAIVGAALHAHRFGDHRIGRTTTPEESLWSRTARVESVRQTMRPLSHDHEF